MNKYRVKVGKHVQGGRTYSQGDIVESNANLDQMFRGKFEVIHGESAVKEKPIPPAAPPAETTPRRTHRAGSPDNDMNWDEPKDAAPAAVKATPKKFTH